MDERSPLDNRSLSHTSREPEGQAWAQIGTKSTISGTKAQTVLPPPAATDPPEVSTSPPPRADEDGMSDDGRPLQVVEDADSERLIEASNETSNEVSNDTPNKASNGASNSTEEKKEGGDAGPTSSDADGDRSEEQIDPEYGLRDRTNSSDPKMIRSRVFVGHLNTDKCSRIELEKLFSPFGKVASCSLQNGYGFVQYYEEQAAKRAITELHGLQFKGMKLVVDKTAAYKRMLGENPNAPKPWSGDRDDRFYEMDLRRREAAVYMYERELYEQSARLELERMYYDRYQPYPRDPYYDRYYDRSHPYREPYVDNHYRPYPERGRYHDRSHYQGSYDRGYYGGRDGYYDNRDRSSYDRPRDDPYERRDKDPYREHQLRDREPFERFDSSRRL